MSTEIAIIVDRLNEKLGRSEQIKAFAFGSAVQSNKTPNDIDIMVVYSDPTIPRRVREILEGLFYTPVHLIFLTDEEELETDFIRKQKCISII
jgi:predicted nucleotidyltransferase